MKKIISILSGLFVVAFIVIKVASAQDHPREANNAATEVKMDCTKCSRNATTANMTCSKKCEMKTCDPAKCKEAKCDTMKCKAGCSAMRSQMTNCNKAKCSGMSKY